MLNRIKHLSLIVVFPCAFAGGFDLQKGVGINDTNLSEIAQTSWEYAKSSTTQKKFNDGFAASFLKVSGSPELYSLSRSNRLYLTNFDTREILGNWSLNPWPYRYASSATIVQHGELGLEYPSTSSNHEYRIYPGVGCYGNAPLRYGDVEGDGKSELVLFLGDFFIIFSPETGKTVFAEKLNESDWLNDKEMLEYYKISGDGTRPTAQYASLLHYENNSFAIGLRAYAKLYFGDFDKDGSPDILAWRKAYRSNPGTNPTKGFTKIEENLQHFKRDVTGEYLPQDTSPETIQNWLSAKNLTWQKGFPSKSECAGEEGKLIPEMHDPLLNDPDVLK